MYNRLPQINSGFPQIIIRENPLFKIRENPYYAMFDTHCHLNFKVFRNKLSAVVKRAKKAGVNYFVVPGTDWETSKKAVEIAEKFSGVYAAVGIHPHHVFNFFKDSASQFFSHENLPSKLIGLSKVKKIVSASSSIANLESIKELLAHPKVVAVGEVGIDKHQYQITKHPNYQITNKFIEVQKIFLKEQMKLAKKYQKSVIVHNREAKDDLLSVLTSNQSLVTSNKMVFHCCEPDEKLLDFAVKYKIYIGVDGDVTYDKKKQEFVKKIPLELLVLETDSPYLHPRLSGSRSWSRYNEPKNLPVIAEFISKLINVSINQLIKTTTKNSQRLFQVNFRLKKYQ